MKHLKYLAGSTLLSLACIGLFIACGDSEGESCLLDSDCVSPDVCEAEVCTPTCNTNDDCFGGEVCELRTNTEDATMVCVPDTSSNNVNTQTGCSGEDDPTAFCEQQLGSGAFCDEANDECVGGENNVANSVFVAQIVDTTTVAAACDESTDPGSDIQGIELQDDTGTSLGWGNLIAENVILDGNDEATFGVLNGEPPGLDSDGCVDDFTGNVLALGCTGWVAVEFQDSNGDIVPLGDGQTIRVYEYGGVCSTGTTDDSWTVYTCDDTAGISSGDDSSCTNPLGNGAGVGTVDVTL